ncbi:universal stress protein [Synechococcus sp. CS-1325]|uniref:universal stress protein n=1 Tax=unclassified Synechococcus TaxID=2626047 RepID=UPI000DB0FC00|nr:MULTISPECIES: universal stress protein [unclassified Synechococcus]PZU98225.1 MAG: universal stress protein [Cyanobium sp.]MCT0199828.1 universal stress protein [Synechococcus sp. CS-1325]MCT0214155.1 universal stress protein [Synechococcus sp. CS-1326]MCT0231378.1 universal stress protein [Synechococcus sp. CS-1324]MCT0232485.1 universal stress protein [Synechococcus sp. CS-1327]
MFEHLLVPIDGSPQSLRAVDGAVAFARERGARITFFHARSNVPISIYGVGELINPDTLQDLINAAKESSDQILGQALEVAKAAGVAATADGVVDDLPAEAILAAAEQHRPDLIFMSSHGRRGLSALLLGSQTQRVITKASLPVLVYR